MIFINADVLGFVTKISDCCPIRKQQIGEFSHKREIHLMNDKMTNEIKLNIAVFNVLILKISSF